MVYLNPGVRFILQPLFSEMKKTGSIFTVKFQNLKYAALIIVVLLLSCSKKDASVCYTCTITYIMTTDVPVDGYPTTSNFDVEICNVTLEEVYKFEAATQASDTAVIQGVTYSSSYSTKCHVE